MVLKEQKNGLFFSTQSLVPQWCFVSNQAEKAVNKNRRVKILKRLWIHPLRKVFRMQTKKLSPRYEQIRRKTYNLS